VDRLRHLIVIVPGIGGSVLVTRDEAAVWGRGRHDLAAALARPGRLSTLDHPDLVPVDVVPRTRVLQWTVIDGYNGLIAKISKTFSDVRVNVARPGQDPDPGANVLLFPYDFRLGIRETAERLRDAVRSRLGDQAGARVIVVAHSMGGLVARYWLGCLGGAPCCRALITVGTPHAGAPKALDWLINGVRAGPLALAKATALLQEWDSSYDLLPCYRAVLPAGGTEPVRVTEIAPFLADTSIGTWFTGRASRALDMYEEIRAGWTAIAEGSTRPEVIPMFGRGHPTPNRAVIVNGRLEVTKDDAEWGPNRGWRGDGTVPANDSIPVELDDQRGAWQAVPQRHQPMANATEIIGILRNLSGESIAIRGAERPPRPWLGLDLDELVPAGAPLPLAAQLLGAEPGEDTAVWASVGGADGGAPPARYPMDYGNGWWRTTIPPLPRGAYRVTVEAVRVPGVDRVVTGDVIGAVTEDETGAVTG
jgi:pimeloyl-ACP methyl ester carboxylesterase